MTTDELRREWVRLLSVGRDYAERIVAAGDGSLDLTDDELARLIGDYRRIDREWDRIDDLLLDREDADRDAAERAELPGFSL